jgi:hypothetical protein
MSEKLIREFADYVSRLIRRSFKMALLIVASAVAGTILFAHTSIVMETEASTAFWDHYKAACSMTSGRLGARAMCRQLHGLPYYDGKPWSNDNQW